jgi:hypothetical protein
MPSITHTSAEGFSLVETAGFSLVETIVATGILATGLLSLAAVFALGMGHVAGSTPGIIAREKAREAVESVHTARDTGAVSWAKIRNVAQGGVFVPGPQPMKMPGVDGIVNTADDASAPLEKMRTPGPDGIIGTSDDIFVPLTDFTREIQITDLKLDTDPTVVNPNLRQIKVIVTYKVGGGWRTYSLTTYVSSFK